MFLDVVEGGLPFHVTQSHNVFKDNVITEPISGNSTVPTGAGVESGSSG